MTCGIIKIIISYTILFRVFKNVTSCIGKTVDVSSTVRAVDGMPLVFFQTSFTEHLSTAVYLLWVSGHKQADQAAKIIRRCPHKSMVIAFQLNVGCHIVQINMCNALCHVTKNHVLACGTHWVSTQMIINRDNIPNMYYQEYINKSV